MFDLAAGGRPLRAVAGLETVVAPACALALLAHPTPLTWPALAVGCAPIAARWIATGRPWRATPFDLALGLFVLSSVVGLVVAPEPTDGIIRLVGLVGALILFARVREHTVTSSAALRGGVIVLIGVVVGGVLLVHVAQPFLLLDRVPPLAWLARLMEPLGLYRFLTADAAALQRFRLYASGVGAVAAVGLAMTVGLALGAVGPGVLWTELRSRGWVRRRRLPLWVALAGIGLFFAALLYAADNRGSMVAAAVALGGVVIWWRPRLWLLGVLFVFGTLDLIALGMVQRGLGLRTIVERLEFWQKGLLLAAETPITGIGLGVHSVQLAYRAAFQPTNPPFNHAHNIFVQALLEQGILGLLGLALLVVGLLRLGTPPRADGDARAHATGLAALGGLVALLVAGLTEIVALTTLGTALMLVLLGLLVAARDAGPVQMSAPTGEGIAVPLSRLVARLRLPHRLAHAAGRRLGATPLLVNLVIGLVLVAGVVTGHARTVAALPFLNAGTTGLYRATLSDDPRASAGTLDGAVTALRIAAAVDPHSSAARRNLALALAANGDLVGARQAADEARAATSPDDSNAMFGVGRAYAAAGDWDAAIATWGEVGAGPQLLRLGRVLADGPHWQAGIAAFVEAGKHGALGRSAADGVARTALAHGESPEAAIARLGSLIASGGMVEYHARLEVARVYRVTGQPELAMQALTDAERVGLDEQIELERALINLALGHPHAAEGALVWIVAHPIEPAEGIPDGDDARYWLAVAQTRVGKPAEALRTARAGLAALAPEQASMRVPYHVLIGDVLLVLGPPVDALTTFRAGQRLAPGDARIADGVARARAALAR